MAAAGREDATTPDPGESRPGTALPAARGPLQGRTGPAADGARQRAEGPAGEDNPGQRDDRAAADNSAGRREDGAAADHGAGQASDAELLRLHVAGDRDAFGTLFLRHRERLWAVAIRTLSDPEDAADAVQEAMISAFRRAGSFRGESAVTTWLHRIVINACLDRMRRRAARPAASGADERVLDSLALASAVPDPAANTAVSLDVMAALRRLPHDQQAVLVLVDMLGYPVADAAEILGISPGTVKSRCARGRARLLPRLAYLRSSGPPGTGTGRGPGGTIKKPGNRSTPGAVLPAQEGGD